MKKNKNGVASTATIDPEILKAISQGVSQAVSEAVKEIKKANEEAEAEGRNYFKETERLLYSYPALKLSLAEYEEDIQENTLIVSREKSKDIIRYSTSNTGSCGLHPDEVYSSKVASIERTRKQIQRINRALDTIQDDEYYGIIPMKYWDGMTPAVISDKLCCDESTYRRNKNRLVNKLKIILFGADALNI